MENWGRKKDLEKGESNNCPCRWPLWVHLPIEELPSFAQGQENSEGILQKKRMNFHISILKNLGGQDQELEKSQSKAGKGKRRGKGKRKRKRKGKGKG